MSYDARTEAEVYKQISAEYESVFSAPLPLKAALDKTVLKSRDCLALTDGVRSCTYAQLSALVDASAAILSQHGIYCGMRVAMRMPNSIAFYVWYHAIHAVGAVAVLIPSLLHAKEVTKILMQCPPDLVISDIPDCDVVLHESGLADVLIINPLTVSAAPVELPASVKAASRSCDDPAVIFYTTGSTGMPRGVVLSARNILANALQSLVRFLSLDIAWEPEKLVVMLPLAHSFGHMTGLWLPLISSSAVYIMSTITRATLKEAMNAFKPTAFFGVPPVYGALCTTRGVCVASVKLFVSGGDFLPINIRNAFALVFGRYICTGYGLSEASPVVGLNISPAQSNVATVSPLIVGMSYKIVAESAVPGAVGELWIKGDNVMRGYFSSSGEEGLGLSSDGWLPTGDLVSEKSDGSLVMVGRSKEIIIFKGFNIYPQEIENILVLHPDVTQVIVIGLDHESFGQIPVACVVMRSGVDFVEKDLVEHCKMALASYKIPHKIIAFKEFSLNHLGKIDRRTVKKNLVC